MRDYRLYCFDGASRITSAETIMARSDDEALQTARTQMNGCFGAEVWERDRLVARLPRSTIPEA